MKTGDILRVDLKKTDHVLFWEIEGVYLGGVGQESVVELKPLSLSPNTEGRTLVPSQLLDVAFGQDAKLLYSLSQQPPCIKKES